MNTTFILYVKDDEFDPLFMCAKFWFPSILCAEVIASDSPSHFPKAIKPVRPGLYLLEKGKNEEEKKAIVAPLAFLLFTLELIFG